MTKFGLSSCTIMVCVSDLSCMKLCEKSHFPCYDFEYKDFHPVIKLLDFVYIMYYI